MAKKGKPRSGSLQFWPRKRAGKALARPRKLPKSNNKKALCFIGYKAGMAHAMVLDNRAHSMTKNSTVSMPITIIECPPIKIAASCFYKKTPKGLRLISSVFNKNLDKDLKRKLDIPKKRNVKEPKTEEYDEIRALVYTQPKKIGFGKKKPDLLEISIGGNKEEQAEFIKDNLGKELPIGEVFEEGEFIDIHAVTKGKGFQGPVKRFGISLTGHKSEKARRNPGSLGPWKGHAHFMWKIAHAGQTGYHKRIEHNKQILKISPKPEEIDSKGGIRGYGKVKSSFILVKGSIPGPKKRAIAMTPGKRAAKKRKEGLRIEKVIIK